ncbi:MAG: HDIG domain-containing protein [Deltaproteobacteria bacterium]|nr:HDIG domain-containing protein [Deltaproteobacteria bacterium]
MIPKWKEKYQQTLRRQGFKKAALLLGVSLLVTLMVTPSLNLVRQNYKEGDTISQTIIIKENITLMDDRSTSARQLEAIKDFPPVFDFDTRLKTRTAIKIKTAFAKMRGAIDENAQQTRLLDSRIRQNSLEQLSTLSQIARFSSHHNKLLAEQKQIIRQIKALSADTGGKSTLELEKQLIDRKTVAAQLEFSDATRVQLDKSLAQLKRDSIQLQRDAAQSERNGKDRLLLMQGEVENVLNINLGASLHRAFLEGGYKEEIEDNIIKLLGTVMEQKILNSFEGFNPPGGAVILQTLDTVVLTRFSKLEEIIELETARQQLIKNGQTMNIQGLNPALRETLVQFSLLFLKPTLLENKGETERQKENLLNTVSPVYFNLKKGEVVARAGERANHQQVEIIRALNNYNKANPKYPHLIGTLLIIITTLVLFYRMINQFSGGKYSTMSRLVLISLLLILPLMLAHLQLLVVPALMTVYDFLPTHTYNLLVPGALASMMASILLGLEVAVFLGFIVSLFMALLMDASLPYFLFMLMGSFVASLPMKHFDTRYALWMQGMRISLINMLVVLVSTLMDQQPMGWLLALDMGAGFLNGLAVAFFTTTLLPFMESGFDITTNMRLLELSNMNHPALKELSVRAPGTYHHSIVVGNLAESAADGVGANTLLVRVAAYYHDLGKMLCPLYFVENQHNKNYHDDLPAKTSARIIISHVKNGSEIAKHYRLGSAITDILEQHHGTSLVRFFFHRASKETEAGDPGPDDMDFRYPGPKPQDKNSGVVMLADVTESATRSLSEPSEDAIREMVQKQTTRIYSEGQLDESTMTFNDLNFIEKTFTKMLLSIHHHRIAYPDLKVVGRAEFAAGDTHENPQTSHSDPENLTPGD